MENIRSPAYWAVLPASVRYDAELRPNAKLLYAEITALANAKGYCFATNDYLATLFGIAKRTVSDLISTLEARGYIKIDVLRDEANAVTERRIYIDRPYIDDAAAPIAKNGYTPIADFSHTPIAKNGYQNNTSNNNIPLKPPKRGCRRTPKKTPDWKPERFAKFWSYYPRGESKQAAIAAWDRLKPDDNLIAVMGRALKRQMATEQWQSGVGIPYASTWINQHRWEDEARAPIPVAKASMPEVFGWQ
ncbi:MAG: helix-turn-helix domain-containing protein [Oscillibacter sp.]|nr:helix-turn-helix domain-containing protein [Oscillibacter sp.]